MSKLRERIAERLSRQKEVEDQIEEMLKPKNLVWEVPLGCLLYTGLATLAGFIFLVPVWLLYKLFFVWLA